VARGPSRLGLMSGAPVELEWLTEKHFRVGSTEFVETYTAGSTADRFHIRKKRALVEAYVEVIRSFPGAAVVELGIAQGGSVALMELVASPRRLIALELDAVPVVGLTDFIERHGVGDHVRPHYGIDQGDRRRVLEIVTEELDGEPLDLVIDDASHLLEPTRASFETLFPLLRPGGRYLIEDWCWQSLFGDQLVAAVDEEGWFESEALEVRLRSRLEQPDAKVQDQFRRAITSMLEDPDPEVRARIENELAQRLNEPEDRRRFEEFIAEAGPALRSSQTVPPPDGLAGTARAGTKASEPTGTAHSPRADLITAAYDSSPLPALAIDLMLARATSGDVIADIHIDGFWISVTRGPAHLDPESFRLAGAFVDHWGLRWH
jgi:cephalosporin hydroxylase